MADRPTRSLFLTVLGGAALAVAAVASGTLVLDHLNVVTAPGCGGKSDCHGATSSVWGSIPGVKWPVSFVGCAYFVAMLVTWITARGELSTGVRWIARVGLVGSLFYIGVMLVEKLFCPYCLASHIANFLFVGTAEVAARRAPRFWAGRGLAGLAGFFLAGSVALGYAESETSKAAETKAKAAAAASTKEMIERSKAQPAKPQTAPTGAAQATPQPAPFTLPTVFTGRYRWGPEVAPIRIVMFTGYQCPDCKKMEAQVEEVMKRKDVSISIKHFPFCKDCNSHVPTTTQPNGCWAARAAEAAGMLKGSEGFFKMHKWLFAHDGRFDNNEQLNAGLAELGWDSAPFIAAMTSPATMKNVQNDIEEAIAYGLHYTPMIFINGVELKGWSAERSLLNAVEALAASNPEAQGPENDHPSNAGDKYVADWREQRDGMAWPPRKPNTYALGAPEATAKVKVQIFGDLLEPNTKIVDKAVRDMLAGRDDIRYEFRFFPLDKSCNPALPQTYFPQGCRAARAAEAAGQLGGDEAYWKMTDWLLANQKLFSDAQVKAAAAGMGLDPAALIQKMDSDEVGRIVALDADIGKRIGIPEIPRIFVNGKAIPRWNLPGQFIIERVIEEAATPKQPG